MLRSYLLLALLGVALAAPADDECTAKATRFGKQSFVKCKKLKIEGMNCKWDGEGLKGTCVTGEGDKMTMPGQAKAGGEEEDLRPESRVFGKGDNKFSAEEFKIVKKHMIQNWQAIEKPLKGKNTPKVALAEYDRALKEYAETLNGKDKAVMLKVFTAKKPHMRAFQALAKGENMAPDKFKDLCAYTVRFMDIFEMFAAVGDSGRAVDTDGATIRIQKNEWMGACAKFKKFGLKNCDDLEQQFKTTDENGGHMVLLQEFSRFALKKHLKINSDIDDDAAILKGMKGDLFDQHNAQAKNIPDSAGRTADGALMASSRSTSLKQTGVRSGSGLRGGGLRNDKGAAQRQAPKVPGWQKGKMCFSVSGKKYDYCRCVSAGKKDCGEPPAL